MRGPMPELVAIAIRERRSAGARPRSPEPMVMDDPQSVAGFHAGGSTVAGMRAVYDFSARALSALIPPDGRVLDLGVGSGRGLARVLEMRSDVRATGVDLAPAMLTEARRLFDDAGVGDRVELAEADLRFLPERIATQHWSAISSVWTLHHLPDRDALRRALRQAADIRSRDGSAVWLLDFQRLRNPESFADLQAAFHPHAPPELHRDAMASEASAFTHEELRGCLDDAGLGDLQQELLQPVPWLQAFWARADGGESMPRSPGRPPSLRSDLASVLDYGAAVGDARAEGREQHATSGSNRPLPGGRPQRERD